MKILEYNEVPFVPTNKIHNMAACSTSYYIDDLLQSGCNCQYLSLSFMQPWVHVSWGRWQLWMRFLFPSTNPNLFFFFRNIRKARWAAQENWFWFFSNRKSFCICLTIRRLKCTQNIGFWGRSDWVCRQWCMKKWNYLSFKWRYPDTKCLMAITYLLTYLLHGAESFLRS